MFRIFLRCSTDEQTTDSQKHEVERWLKAYHPEAEAKFYEEPGVSGDAKDRPVFARLCKEARKGDSVVCWALDRLSRAGIVSVLSTVQNFRDKGVNLISISEPWADSTNPVSEVVIAVMAWAAQQEKARIKARQKAGIASAKAQGKTWGGRKKGQMQVRTAELDSQVRQLRAAGESISAISRTTKVSRITIRKILEG